MGGERVAVERGDQRKAERTSGRATYDAVSALYAQRRAQIHDRQYRQLCL